MTQTQTFDGWACIHRAPFRVLCVAPHLKTVQDKVREFGPDYEVTFGRWNFRDSTFVELARPHA